MGIGKESAQRGGSIHERVRIETVCSYFRKEEGTSTVGDSTPLLGGARSKKREITCALPAYVERGRGGLATLKKKEGRVQTEVCNLISVHEKKDKKHRRFNKKVPVKTVRLSDKREIVIWKKEGKTVKNPSYMFLKKRVYRRCRSCSFLEGTTRWKGLSL